MSIFDFWRRKKPQAAPAITDPVLLALTNARCPDCNGESFACGPQVGRFQDIICIGCHQKFCVAPFDNGWLGPLFFAKRIGTRVAEPVRQ